MDPLLVWLLCPFVTELTTDPAVSLVSMRQGNLTLEDHLTDLPEFVYIDFFCYGLNQPLIDHLIRNGPRGSLGEFLDFALFLKGSHCRGGGQVVD